MNKVTKSLFKLIISSTVVWLAVVMIFARDTLFNNGVKPDEGNGIPDGSVFEDGTYTGKSVGHNGGDLVVEVTIVDGKIANVEIIEHTESDGISDPAIDGIPQEIVESNSTDVDLVSGATVSSKAIIKAVNDALKQSIKD